MKLAVNLVIGGLAELMAEALVLGEASGVSRAALLEVMGTSAAGAPFVRYKTDALLRDDYSATFTTALMEKDVDLVLDVADEAGVELPVANELKVLLRAAIESATETTTSWRSSSVNAAARPSAGRASRSGGER